MVTYKIFVKTWVHGKKGDGILYSGRVALATEVIDFNTKEEALFALECLQAQHSTLAIPLFRTL